MKRIVLITVLVLLLAQGKIFPCSTFCLKDGNGLVVGFNFDWYSSHGFVVTNNKGIKKTAFMPFQDVPVKWISKYGSITFNVFGKEFPMAGMNEVGLVITIMWLDETKYQEIDKRYAITELQWVQYQLDNSATIEDVLQSEKILRITNKTTAPLHFLVCDKSGNTVTIELLNRRLVYHTGDELPVPLLCNDKYDKSMKSLIEFMDFGSRDADLSSAMEMVKGKYDDDRFIKGTNAIKEFQQKANADIIGSAFNILGELKQPHTNWSIVFDLKNFQIQYKTDNNTAIRLINLDDYKYESDSKNLMIDINIGKANEKPGFEYFTIEKNKLYMDYIVQNIVSKADGLNRVPLEFWNKMAYYPGEMGKE
jgi:penicillin V acylase-like amidase (Ntn superfamily)